MRFLFFLLFLSGPLITRSQDTLLLLSGREIVVTSVTIQDEEIAYRKASNNKRKTIHPTRVFSVKYHDGQEKIIYEQDTLDPIDFKVEEMRIFIRGMQDAREQYDNRLVQAVGFGVGVPASLLAIYGLVVPPLYATVLGGFSPKVNRVLSINVGGTAASDLGIVPAKYLNEVTGTATNPTVKKNQVLKLSGRKIEFEEDTELNEAIRKINEQQKCGHVNAVNEKGKLRLYKTESTSLISNPIYKEGFEKRVRDYKIRNGMICALIGFVAGSITFAMIAD